MSRKLLSNNQKILVTGGSGFIGSHLVDALVLRKYEVTVLDLKPSMDNSVKTIIGSVTDRALVNKLVSECDLVFHLAGMLGTHELVDIAFKATEVNVLGTLNVLDACKKYGTKIVEISKPNCWINTYTITKIAAEQFTEMYRREHGVEAVIVKWFNVYGGRQPLMEEAGYKKLIPTAIVNALHNVDIEIYGDGNQTMDLVHTTDTIEATLSIMDNWDKCEGKVFEVGFGKEISVNESVEKIIELTNSTSKIIHIPMRKGETPNTHLKANISLLKDICKWTPRINLNDGLRETVDWYKKHYA